MGSTQANAPRTSAILVEAPRSRVSVEVERMARGPAKVTVRIDGDNSEAVAQEVLSIYQLMVREVSTIEDQLEKAEET